MALDGIWDTTTKTPMGPQKGKMTFKVEGDKLTGTALSSQGESAIQEGKANGDAFEFMIESKSPMGMIKVTMNGKVDGDVLTATAKTPMGPANVTGKRVG